MSNYLIVNPYGDLVASFDSYKDAQAYLIEVDDEDNRGYYIKIIEQDYEEDIQH